MDNVIVTPHSAGHAGTWPEEFCGASVDAIIRAGARPVFVDIERHTFNLNTDQLEVYPSLASDGTLYFSSGRPGGYGKNDLYRSRPTEGGWSEPENLGGAINTEQSEGDLYVAPDQSYIVFVSSGRDDSIGAGDLYVSFRAPDGSWGASFDFR